MTPGGPSKTLEYPHATVELSSPITSVTTGGEPTIGGCSLIDATPVPLTGNHPQVQYHDRKRAKDEGTYAYEEGDLSLLSHLAFRLRDSVPRGTHAKGNISYPRTFTGRDIVVSAV